FIISLTKASSIDKKYYERDFSVYTIAWSGEQWKERLKQIVSFNDKKSTNDYISTTVKEAFLDLQEEFAKNGITAEINSYENPYRMEIEIHHDIVNNFLYGVKNEARVVSEYLLNEENLPDLE